MYRFENGSLYEYDSAQNAYIYVFCNARAKTEAQAIKMYLQESYYVAAYSKYAKECSK